MKISVEFSEKELDQIRQVTGEKKKGPAVRRLALEALQLRRRRQLNREVLDGKWGVDWPDVDTLRKDRVLWR